MFFLEIYCLLFSKHSPASARPLFKVVVFPLSPQSSGVGLKTSQNPILSHTLKLILPLCLFTHSNCLQTGSFVSILAPSLLTVVLPSNSFSCTHKSNVCQPNKAKLKYHCSQLEIKIPAKTGLIYIVLEMKRPDVAFTYKTAGYKCSEICMFLPISFDFFCIGYIFNQDDKNIFQLL